MGVQYDVRITLIAQQKRCPSRHQVGDQFVVGRMIPEEMCSAALRRLLPHIEVLRSGAESTRLDDSYEMVFCCPEADPVNTWRLERMTDEEAK